MCYVAKEETNRFRHVYETITQEYNAVKETLKKTSEERDELTMRLSKLANTSLTHNNPNIADLSDPNRPTKLAEIFSELYDNEWTDAFEKLKSDDERTTVDRLLTILQKAYEFSVTLTDQASNDMGGKLTSLSLKYNKGSNVQALHKSGSRHAGKCHEDTTELRDPPETRIEDKSAANSSLEYSENVKSDCDTIGEQARYPEEMDVSTLSLDFDILSPTEKQTINAIRKRVLHGLKDQIIPVITNAVVGEMNLHACDDSIITYVKACASICWEMRIHQPPVCLEFLEIDDQTPFNIATYKHYNKIGRRIDYIVWPAMYLCKRGPLLNKGVAQGN